MTLLDPTVTATRESTGTQMYDGLVAEAYVALVPPEIRLPDDDFYESTLLNADGPVLELGCGNGRLVWRLVMKGVEAEGIDTSPDMLEVGRLWARARGLAPERIRKADMRSFQDPARYAAVYCTDGTFMLTGSKEQGIQTLRQAHEALRPGGTLSLSLAEETAQTDGLWRWRTSVYKDEWAYTLQEARSEGPEPQSQLVLKRIDKFDQQGILVDSSLRLHRLRWWNRAEIAEVLDDIGFVRVEHLSNGLEDTWITVATKSEG
jgi:SAM-dependent methyltransferase